MIPLGDLRRKLTAVNIAAHDLEHALSKNWALPYEEGHLALDFENIEDRLRLLQTRVSMALLSTQTVVALAAVDDAAFWDEAKGLAS